MPDCALLMATKVYKLSSLRGVFPEQSPTQLQVRSIAGEMMSAKYISQHGLCCLCGRQAVDCNKVSGQHFDFLASKPDDDLEIGNV